MKFKDIQENKKVKMPKELYNGFTDLIQFEIDKLIIIESAKFYFYENGMMNYKKFFKHLYKSCEKIKNCLVSYLRDNSETIPEFNIAASDSSFKDYVEPFKMLAEMEDIFEEKLNNLINLAFNNKDWKTFHYLLKKLDTIDHICCRALAAVENKQDVLTICEQHILEN